ncbi:hypothetical protein B0H11DRAFT_178141 [Mycena galericulata]|nr:hypothetical protein B0H11DRAFT_178141 [Mycena galericulata]
MDSEPAAESSKRRAPRAAAMKRKAETNASGSSAPKRPRTMKKKGSLQKLLDISLDVLFEIFGNLQPLDVLRLSRTSKEFRDLLMRRSSITIWKSSLNNVPGLPPCPQWMTEPQWVSLVFDPTCQVCQKIARKVDWGLFIRICGKCAKTHVSSSLPRLRDPDMIRFVELVPTRPDFTKPYKTVYFCEEIGRVRASYNALKDREEKKKFVEERKELVKSLKELSKSCEAWSQGIADNRSTELADLRENRFNAITAKLTALGWGVELDNILPMDSLHSHKLVKQPHVLTDRTWSTIEPEMVRYMEQMKAKRLLREHAALVVKRKAIATKVFRTFKRSQLPWTDVMPGGPDFCEFPEISAIIKAAVDVDVDEHTFEAMLPDFPVMIATWREKIVGQVVKVHKRSGQSGVDDDSIKARLPLATSVYKCSTCISDYEDGFYHQIGSGIECPCRPLFWPRVLAHRCLTRTDFSSMLMFMDASQDVMWRTGPLEVDSSTVEIVEKIVTACGLDPATATVEEMDAADARLACHACAKRAGSAAGPSTSALPGDAGVVNASGGGKATVHGFSWRNAVRHEGEKHFRVPTAWHMLDATDATAVRALERAAIAKARAVMDAGQDLGSDDEYMPDADASGSEDGESSESSTSEDGENVEDDVMQAEKDAAADAAQDGDPAGGAASAGASILPAALPELAWSCGHCLDSPREEAPMSLADMRVHLLSHHIVPAPGVLNDDYYRAPAAPEVYSSVHFPAPSVEIAALPPAPPMERRKVQHRSVLDFGPPYDFLDYDSDDSLGPGYYSDEDDYMW